MDRVDIILDVLHDECKKRWGKYSYINEPHHRNEHVDLAKRIVVALEGKETK